MTENRHSNSLEARLEREKAEKLWGHIRALEVLDEQVAEVRLDISARKDLAKADGFDTKTIEAIKKRRKEGLGQSMAADNLLRIYEDALDAVGAPPLEQTKKPREAEERRTLEQIDKDLHGDVPEQPKLSLN